MITGLTKAKMEKIIAKSEQIEQKLLELNLRLVHSIALQHQGMGLELDDLVYEGEYVRINYTTVKHLKRFFTDILILHYTHKLHTNYTPTTHQLSYELI